MVGHPGPESNTNDQRTNGILESKMDVQHQKWVSGAAFHQISSLSLGRNPRRTSSLKDWLLEDTVPTRMISEGRIDIDSACILFVGQPNERNVFDQRWLEYELLE
jgi:hypothetical protein